MFLHVLEDSFLHDEVSPLPYDLLYVSLRSGRSLGMDLMLRKMQKEPSNSTLNQLSSLSTWIHCRRTRLWLRIHTSLKYISMMLATSQTRLPTPTTFPT